jgi:pimeloyl-ACP methyl ester carboxylesterase
MLTTAVRATNAIDAKDRSNPVRTSRADDAPDWFVDALAKEPARFTVDVEGCAIRCRAWGNPELPLLVFVHGGGAHSGWWDHIAPFFTTTHRVLAPDLSGHGDSGRRERYGLGAWAREVLAVAAHVAPGSRPTVVGHSLGGWVTSTAALKAGPALDGIVVIDSPMRERAPEAERLRQRRGRPHGYRTREQILSRFRAVPRQDSTLPYVAAHIAGQSVRRTGLRWFWKFDPAVYQGTWTDVAEQREALDDVFARTHCRMSYLRCERGLVSQDMAERIRDILQLRGPFVELPEAGHHPMLDQPLALVAALRTLLEVWSIT